MQLTRLTRCVQSYSQRVLAHYKSTLSKSFMDVIQERHRNDPVVMSTITEEWRPESLLRLGKHLLEEGKKSMEPTEMIHDAQSVMNEIEAQKKTGRKLRSLKAKGLQNIDDMIEKYASSKKDDTPIRVDSSRSLLNIDFLLGAKCLSMASKAGIQEAMCMLGNVYHENGMFHDAIKCYEDASQGLNPNRDALFNLGMIYYDGIKNVVDPDVKKSFAFFQEAASLGDPESCYWIGHCLISGEGGNGVSDVVLGVEYMEKAASLNHPGANYYLATIFHHGWPQEDDSCSANTQIPKLIPSDLAKFHEYLDKAVTLNDASACFAKADMLLNGLDGCQIDRVLGFQYLEKCRQLQFGEAIMYLATCYYHGLHGLPKDRSIAFDMYNEAARNDCPDAWRNVAAMYLVGDGVEKCEKSAEEIMRAHFHVGVEDLRRSS